MTEKNPKKEPSSNVKTFSLKQKFINILSKINKGKMHLTLPDGSSYSLGPGGVPEANLVINNWRALRRLVTQGDMGFVESYLDEDWTSPNPAKVVEIAILNRPSAETHKLKSFWHKLLRRLEHIRRPNTKKVTPKIENGIDL